MRADRRPETGRSFGPSALDYSKGSGEDFGVVNWEAMKLQWSASSGEPIPIALWLCGVVMDFDTLIAPVAVAWLFTSSVWTLTDDFHYSMGWALPAVTMAMALAWGLVWAFPRRSYWSSAGTRGPPRGVLKRLLPGLLQFSRVCGHAFLNRIRRLAEDWWEISITEKCWGRHHVAFSLANDGVVHRLPSPQSISGTCLSASCEPAGSFLIHLRLPMAMAIATSEARLKSADLAPPT